MAVSLKDTKQKALAGVLYLVLHKRSTCCQYSTLRPKASSPFLCHDRICWIRKEESAYGSFTCNFSCSELGCLIILMMSLLVLQGQS